MANKTAPHRTQLTADSRLYNLGYSRGYEEAHEDGLAEGAEAFQGWLLAELRDLAQDVRLNLRSDTTTPLEVLTVIMEIVQAGKPVWPVAADEQRESDPHA